MSRGISPLRRRCWMHCRAAVRIVGKRAACCCTPLPTCRTDWASTNRRCMATTITSSLWSDSNTAMQMPDSQEAVLTNRFLVLDPASPVPVYHQLRLALESSWRSRFDADDELPTEREIMDEFRV